MKTITFLFLGLGILLAGAMRADPSPAAAETARLDASALDTLAGPVALYPDTLLAVILPASTNPADIVLAARYLENGGDAAQIDNQPWDASVRALAHYPDVLRWMDENLAWTQQLGAAVIAQPEDVMAAVQRLRGQAQSVGNLPSNEQLTVVNEGDYIRIIPTRTEVVYVPYYDPAVVYVSRVRYYYGPAWPCGPWLSYDCNWIGRSIWIGAWSPSWYYRPAWRYGPPPPPHLKYRHTWRPNPHRPPPPHRPPGPVIHPRPPRGNPDWAHANPPHRHPRPPNYQRPSDQRPTNPPPGRNPGSRPPPRHQSFDRQETASNITTTHFNRHTTTRTHYDGPAGFDNRATAPTGHPRIHGRQSAATMTDRRAANTTVPRQVQRTSPSPLQQQAVRPSRQQPRPSVQPAPSQQARPSQPPARTQPRAVAPGRSSERQDKATASPRSSSSRDSSRQQTRPGRS
ncbi:DUF3300 domain-containing protein [Termitidicoccus mucosus]|uniref:DUF3300 domain-containing protein n=1 Tax=Termitidicoccus mucosus TaxID=1184151 RepID=A0A178IIR0_9BACT|nr:hypothetical protein AW736_14330 [Opitutaceae bacterium TSB47]